jgi:hypothetical protein
MKLQQKKEQRDPSPLHSTLAQNRVAKNLLELSGAEAAESLGTVDCFKANPLSTNKDEVQISGAKSGPRKLVGPWRVGLLVVAHGQFSGDRFEVAKEAAFAPVGAGGEIELGGG